MSNREGAIMSQLGFADLGMTATNARRDRLGRIEAAIDWAPVAALLSGLRTPGGRPAYEALAMFRALLLGQWHDLSDPALEDALADRASFRRFCGFSLDARTPDETTLCRFRNALKEAGLGAALFEEVARQLDERGYVLRKGTIIDATLIESAVRPPPSGSTPKGIESRSALDAEADWTRRGEGRRLFFGYKAHVAIDQGSGLIRRHRLSGAKLYESEAAEDLICGDEGAVGACPRAGRRPDPGADKAYEKRARREALKARGCKDRIQHRRHKHQRALPHWQAVRNRLIARVRGAVERLFSQLKGVYGMARMRYRGLAANALRLDLVAIAYNLRRAADLAA
jgi:IS5 family transposase